MSGHGWRWSFEFALEYYVCITYVSAAVVLVRRVERSSPAASGLRRFQRLKWEKGRSSLKCAWTWWFLCCLYMNRYYEKRSKTQFVDRHIDTYHPCQANVHADTYSAHHLISWKSRKAFFYDKQFVYALGNRALLYLQICSCWRFRGSNSIHAAVE